MLIVVQFGFSKGFKESQYVEAHLNGDKLTWNKNLNGEYDGHFVTQISQKSSKIWFLARCECSHGDILKLETSVFINGAGYDEDRSRVMEFRVDENVEPTEFDIHKVGDREFPLVSGKVQLIQSRSKLQDRQETGENLIQESKIEV